MPKENIITEHHLIEKVNSDIFKGCKQELKEFLKIIARITGKTPKYEVKKIKEK